MGELVRAFQALVQQGSEHERTTRKLDGQCQAILDNASVGIVISRHGVLDVVGRQACLMLGYAAGELQG
ncbi:hypothetical protein ACXWPE_09535, partial [Streptococcus pyogenes]